MALYRFLQNVIDEGVPFTPEDVAQLGAVYEAMLVVLRLEDRADPITEIVAKKIIEIFRSGERDSAQICHRAIKELGIPNLDQPWGLSLGVLVIKCPNTGRELSTGIQTDASTFTRMPNEVLETRCPHCRTKHSWRPRDAIFVDALPPADWIEKQEQLIGALPAHVRFGSKADMGSAQADVG